MLKVLSASFDSVSFERYGSNWMRSAKSKGYVGLVLDCGLTQSFRTKISDLKFRCVSVGNSIEEKCKAISGALSDKEKCLYVQPDFDFKDEGFFEDEKMVFRPGTGKIAHRVFPIVSLHKRAEVANVVEKSGVMSDPQAICAGPLDWQLLAGVFGLFVGNGFIDVRWAGYEGIVLDIFASYFTERIRVLK